MESKKNPKADVGTNGSIYFAVGLALMLFLTYSTINLTTNKNIKKKPKRKPFLLFKFVLL